jgi:CRISPR-associated Cas5-like protein
MRGILVDVYFSEALFKTHYTKGFRQTYPIPLPTTVAGMFGAMLGIRRSVLATEFNDCLFGAKLLKYKGLCLEKSRFIQYASGGIKRGAVTTIIINNPCYRIAVASSNENKIISYSERMKNYIHFLPYGGQNDFFAEEVKIIGEKDANETKLIGNYAPQDHVDKILWEKGTEFQSLPVRHRFSDNPNFYFIYNGKLLLKRENLALDDIAVYSLAEFYLLPLTDSVQENAGGMG